MARGNDASQEVRQREALGLGQSIDIAAASPASCYFPSSQPQPSRPGLAWGGGGQPGTCFCWSLLTGTLQTYILGRTLTFFLGLRGLLSFLVMSYLLQRAHHSSLHPIYVQLVHCNLRSKSSLGHEDM